MKKIFLILCVFFSLINAAMSAEIYNCVDKDGNSFMTDNPPEDVKCKLNTEDDESAAQNKQSDNEVKPAGQDDANKSQKGEVKKLLNIPRSSY